MSEEIQKGSKVRIYTDPQNQLGFEGNAQVLKVIFRKRNIVYCSIVFEDGFQCNRMILDESKPLIPQKTINQLLDLIGSVKLDSMTEELSSIRQKLIDHKRQSAKDGLIFIENTAEIITAINKII